MIVFVLNWQPVFRRICGCYILKLIQITHTHRLKLHNRNAVERWQRHAYVLRQHSTQKRCLKQTQTCPHNSHDVIRRLLCSRNDNVSHLKSVVCLRAAATCLSHEISRKIHWIHSHYFTNHLHSSLLLLADAQFARSFVRSLPATIQFQWIFKIKKSTAQFSRWHDQ